jgi:hypothetical protein
MCQNEKRPGGHNITEEGIGQKEPCGQTARDDEAAGQ